MRAGPGHGDRLGAIPAASGIVEFRVWAPNALSVDVCGMPLEPEGNGVFSARLPGQAGDDYGFSLDGGGPLPDPCSRWQPDGLRGPSRVLDTSGFGQSAGRVALRLDTLVIYELHVGTFTIEGTFDAAIARLPELAALGVTAVELMPVSTFPGERGWGYDGVLIHAPHRVYGGPGGLARFVAAAHEAGLGVILDVVYNHVGPGSHLLAAYGPYFSDRHPTLWGDGIDYSQPGVREWAIQNAELWVGDYGVDGLRLDATNAIMDESVPHVMVELANRLRALNPDVLVISEIARGDRRPVEEWGHDAQWADDFHHALHVLLTGERDGYYAQFGAVADLARAYEALPSGRLVVYAQNHDQIGNRAYGDRLPLEARHVAAACLLFAPHVPLLFMGEECGESRPFQFFTDHDDPAIAQLTREGRRREFARFASFARPEHADEALRAVYAELIELRRQLPLTVETTVDEERRTLRVRRGDVELVADFANLTVEIRR